MAIYKKISQKFRRRRQEKTLAECHKKTKIKKKPAPTVDRGDRPDNCGSKERRRGITSLRSENFSSRIGTRVMD